MMGIKEKSAGFRAEFKKFVMRGNVIDLAVGVIIGGAFATITNSLVNDVLMPFIGLFIGGIDFSTWSFTIPAIFAGAEPALINIGLFIQAVVNFLIMAFVIFLIVKAINRLHRKEEAAPPPPPEPSKEELLLAEIRDLLKEQNK